LAVMQPPETELFPDVGQAVYTIKTESFEGPFDLLLHLIKKNEIDIYNIPIASITRQYLDYLDIMQELNLDIAGDFLVMASTLIHIKSRMLLPNTVDDEEGDEEEEDPRAELVARLLEYQKYKEGAISLNQREMLGRDTFVRSVASSELAESEPDVQPLEVDLFGLIEAFRKVLASVPEETFHEVGAEGPSIADRISELLVLLDGVEAAGFADMFAGNAGRDDVIVTFLAILELCRLRIVKLSQSESFGTIWIIPALTNLSNAEITEEEVGRDFT